MPTRIALVVGVCSTLLFGCNNSKPVRNDCSCSFTCSGSGAQLAHLSVCETDDTKAVEDAKSSCGVHAPCAGATCTCQCQAFPSADVAACNATDLCATGNGGCPSGSTCTSFLGGVACSSGAGGGSGGGTGGGGSDVDPCDGGTANCDAHATCHSSGSTFTCTCNTGYAGSGTTCADVDECDAGTAACSPNAICSNTIGSYGCSCAGGFLGDGGTCLSVIPPTGLSTCYPMAGACPGTAGSSTCASTPFCGQDVQYPARSRTFTVTTSGSDSVVTDSRTQLSWMKSFLGPMSAQDGINACAALNYAGTSGWRLPGQIEMFGLIDLGTIPVINADFDLPPGPGQSFFYASTVIPDVGCGTSTFYAALEYGSFNTGGSCSPLNSEYVRCAKGPTWNGDLPGRFISSTIGGQLVISDNVSGLQWQGGASDQGNSTTTWATALAKCEGSGFAGFTDWRLPDYQEALTIALQLTTFGESYENYLLTSSWISGRGVVMVRMGDGLGEDYLAPTDVLNSGNPGGDTVVIRCVRGGGR